MRELVAASVVVPDGAASCPEMSWKSVGFTWVDQLLSPRGIDVLR
ncbi:hypothetical protein [Lentzea xinjiangensis]|nr:hypothetical protein [Lentzea xinjiangensis]